eukprot:6455040-Amphidinium_carterae.1
MVEGGSGRHQRRAAADAARTAPARLIDAAQDATRRPTANEGIIDPHCESCIAGGIPILVP